MTSEEFRSDEELRKKLKVALADPTLQLALRVLKDDLLPLSGAATEGNPTVSASRYQQLAGAGMALAGLDILTTPVQARAKILPKRLSPE